MGATSIEWTEVTWNPIVGCSIVSPGCTHCYAMRMAARIERMNPTGGRGAEPARRGSAAAKRDGSNSNYVNHYDGTTQQTKAGPVWTGKIGMASEKILRAPLSWKRPTLVFINSMGDLFHESIPDESILRVLDIIRRTSWDGGSNCGKISGSGQHIYQVLTKRAARMASFMPRLRFNQNTGLDDVGLYLADDGRPSIVMKNLWLGVSAERQQEADERISLLLATPAAVRFVSAEPLLGPIDLKSIQKARVYGTFLFDATTGASRDHHGMPFSSTADGKRLDWIIVGGESGPDARPMHPDWARALRDQCAAASVPFFFKQWGEWASGYRDQMGAGEMVFRRFASFDQWVNKADTWVNRGICLDKHGVELRNGAAFMAARDADLFPVTIMHRIGKKAAGCKLDGVEHKAMPVRP